MTNVANFQTNLNVVTAAAYRIIPFATDGAIAMIFQMKKTALVTRATRTRFSAPRDFASHATGNAMARYNSTP